MTTRADRLIERDAELAALADALAAARDGTGALVLLEGPAGIGKTALLAAAREAARDAGLTPLRARATEFERDHAYGVVRQLLEPLLRELDGDRRSALLAGAAAHAAPVLGFGEPSAHSSAFAVLNGLYWLLVDLAAQRPLVLLVDDAQWTDEPSLAFIAFLAPRVASQPIAVLVAARDDGQGPRSAVLDEVRSDPVSSRMTPRPLSTAGAARLLGEELGRARGTSSRTHAGASPTEIRSTCVHSP